MTQEDMMDCIRQLEEDDYNFICLKDGLDNYPIKTVKELSILYGISERQVYRWAKEIYEYVTGNT